MFDEREMLLGGDDIPRKNPAQRSETTTAEEDKLPSKRLLVMVGAWVGCACVWVGWVEEWQGGGYLDDVRRSGQMLANAEDEEDSGERGELRVVRRHSVPRTDVR